MPHAFLRIRHERVEDVIESARGDCCGVAISLVNWQTIAMNTRVDRSGRLVLPKPLRRQLGLEHGGEVEVTVDGSALRIEPVASGRRVIERVGDWPTLSRVETATLTDDDVRALRDEQR